jgi:glycosyltransferase involved in cell wall biosynthesis
MSSNKKELEKMGHELYILAPEYPHKDSPLNHDSEKNVYRFSSYSLLFTSHQEDRLVFPWNKKAVYRVLDQIKPDIIHIQSEFALGVMVLKYAKKKNIPIIVTAHTYWEEYTTHYFPFLPQFFLDFYVRIRAYRFYNQLDLIITPTGRMKHVIENYHVKTPIEIIPTGIPADNFSGVNKIADKENSMFVNDFPVIKNKKILLFSGRLCLTKNIAFLINIAEKVIHNYPDTVFILAGDGPQREELKALVRKKNLTDKILFTGYVAFEKIKYLYSIADILLMASKSETQGLVIVEAMLTGTPVVAIGEMGIEDVMKGDNGGFMVKDDFDEFYSRVITLLTDPVIYQKKSDDARNFAQNWTIDRTAARLESVYKDTISKYQK